MKKTIILICTLVIFGAAQPPTKLFDVRGGGATQTNIVYRDAAAKDLVIDAFCTLGSYQDTISGLPNPQTRQQFFNNELQQIIRDKVAALRHQVAAAAAHIGVDETDLPSRVTPTPTPTPVPALRRK